MRKEILIGLTLAMVVSLLMGLIHPFDGVGDFYHHVNFGRWIVQHKSLMQFDEFTHTAAGYPVIDNAWVSGIVYYLVLTSFGETGVRIFTSLIAGLVTIMMFWWLLKLELNKRAAVAAVFLTMSVIAVRWPARPELFGYVFLLAIFLVERFAQKRPFLALLMPLVVWLWGIFYGVEIPMAWGVVGLLTVKNFRQIKWFGTAFVLSILVGFLNGYGSDTVFYFFKYIPAVAVYEAEWAGIPKLIKLLPPVLWNIYKYYLGAYAVYLIVLLTLLVFGWKQIKQLKIWGVFAGSILLPIVAFRQLANATILTLPLLAKLTDRKWKLVLVAISGAVVWLMVARAQTLTTDPDIEASFMRMVQFVNKNNISGRAFNHLHMGAKLTYYLYPKILVFYDTRDDLFLRGGVWGDLYEVYSSGESIVPLLQKYKVDLVFADLMTDRLNYEELFNGNGWKVVWLDDRYFVAVSNKLAAEKHLSELPVNIYLPGGLRPGREELGVEYFTKLEKEHPSRINAKYLEQAQGTIVRP